MCAHPVLVLSLLQEGSFDLFIIFLETLSSAWQSVCSICFQTRGSHFTAASDQGNSVLMIFFYSYFLSLI